MISGIVYIAPILAFFVLQVIFSIYCKKITNNYFFWLAIGILCLTYMIAFKIVPEVQALHQAMQAPNWDPTSRECSLRISRAFLLDWCPFGALFLPIALIIDPSRKLAKVWAPIGLFTCLMTFVEIGCSQVPLSWDWFFFGPDANRGRLMYHFIGFAISWGVMLSTPKFKAKGLVYTTIAMVLYTCYVIVIKYSTNCEYYLGGFFPNDYKPGSEFEFLNSIFKLPIYICPFQYLFYSYLAICCFMLIKDLLFDHFKGTRFGNEKNTTIKVFTNKKTKKQKEIPEFWKWYNFNSFDSTTTKWGEICKKIRFILMAINGITIVTIGIVAFTKFATTSSVLINTLNILIGLAVPASSWFLCKKLDKVALKENSYNSNRKKEA